MNENVGVIFRGAMLLALSALWQATAGAAVLYDGTGGTTPNNSPWGWGYFPDNGTDPDPFPHPTMTVDMSASGGGTLLETLTPITDRAGFFRTDQNLDRTVGFTLSFDLRLFNEVHNTADRSGFSVIAISNSLDRKGIELSFWPNEIFAKEGDANFSHAEGIPATTNILRTYQLTIQGDNYTLTGTGLSSSLSGLLRDYRMSSYDVYREANFLFLGDNTTSASAEIFLNNITFQAIPEPGTLFIVFTLVLMIGIVWKVQKTRAKSQQRLRYQADLLPEAVNSENPYVAPQSKL